MPRNNNIQFRSGDYSEWSAARTGILASGEPGFVTDFNILKVGDGTKQWSDLPAVNDSLITIVRNDTGSTINKMSVVYINGAQGDTPRISLGLASGEASSSKTYGLVVNNITTGNIGTVIVDGTLRNLNTLTQFSGIAEGTALWLSPTVSGGITTTKPYAPYHAVFVGTLIRVHQTQGVINVKIQNGYELEELHNVSTTGATNGQFLQYNSGSGLWFPSSSGNFTNLTINNNQIVTGTGIANHIAYWNSNSGIVADSGQLYWDNANNKLGIGLNNPNYTLDVNGNGNFNSDFYLSSDIIDYSLGSSLIWFNPGPPCNLARIQASTSDINSKGILTFWVADGSSEVERLTILDNGNVGIGTTSPSETLTVIGNTQIDGLLSASSGEITNDFTIGENLTVNGNFTVDNYIDIISSGISSINIIKFNDNSTPNAPSLGSISNGTRLLLNENNTIGHNAIGIQYAGINGTWFSVPSGGTFTFYNGTSSQFTLNSTSLNYGNLSINSDGSITGGSWSASTIPVNKGGTGRTSYTNGQLLIGSGTSLVANTLTAGSGISITNGSGSITINTSGLQTSLTNPVTGTGTAAYIAKWSSSSGLSNSLIYDNGTNIGIGTTSPSAQLHVIGTGNFSQALQVNGTGVSISGHNHTSSDISNFGSAVSGLLPTISNSGDNRVLTSTGSSLGINAESNLTFDGQNLSAPYLLATYAAGDEGGEIQLTKPPNATLSGGITIDAYQNRLRFFEQGGSARGFYLDISSGGAGASTNLAGAGGATSVSNYSDNRIITSDGTTTGLNAESNFTFNGSLLTITGSGSIASGLFLTDQTASTIASFDSNKKVVSLSTGTYPSLTELSYVKGVTSAIQTQLNNKQNTITNPVTGTGIINHIAYWSSSSDIIADSGQLVWDSTNNRLGIGVSSPTSVLHVIGNSILNGDVSSTGSFIAGSGTALLPSFEFINDPDTGLFSPAANTFAISTSGAERLRIDNIGKVGIGITNPTTTLQVDGSFSCGVGGDPVVGGQGLYVDPVTPILRLIDSGPNYVAEIGVDGLTLYDIASNDFFHTDRANGRIGIGTATPEAELDVQSVNGGNGTIKCNYITSNILLSYNDWYSGVVGNVTIGDLTTLSHINWSIDADGNASFGLVNGNSLGAGSFNGLSITDNSPTNISVDSGPYGLVLAGDGAIDITSAVSNQINLNGNVTFTSYTESVVADGNSGTSKTLSLASGTVHTCTLTGNCTFTMPTATAGKSFTMFLNSGSGNYTASFSGVRWADSATPTATITASKVDIYSFISDGTYWYGSFSQNYG